MYEFMIGRQIKRLKWSTTERIKLEDIDNWITENPDRRAYYHTIQTFNNHVRTEGEKHWCPMYFDLDANEDRNLTVEDALQDARKLAGYFSETYSIDSQVWFSGNRGFHILVNGLVFGAVESDTLTYSWRHVAENIKEMLALATLDNTVYSYPRMWRIENTPNPKQDFYKIALTLQELNTLDVGDIVSLAVEPRNIKIANQEVTISHPELVKLFADSNDEYQERQEVQEIEFDKEYKFGDVYPECIAFLLEKGLAVLGTKNRADMAMANFFKAFDAPIQDAKRTMCEWSRNIPINLTHVHNPDTRESQTMAVLSAVYSGSQYRFSCGSILTCGMKVDCDNCIVKEIKPIEVALADHAKSEYMSAKIYTKADAIGRDSHDLLIPEEIKGWCRNNPEISKCVDCPQQFYYNAEKARNERIIKFDASNPKTVPLIDMNQRDLMQKVRYVFGIHNRCVDFKFDIEWINAMGLYVAPTLTDFAIEESVGRVRVMYFGHGLKLNTSYGLLGYVHPHPRTMQATFLVEEATPLSSTLANFTLSKSRLKELKIFQKKPEQNPLDKIKEIHAYFINDFLFIFGRGDLIMGVDLVYHSVRRFNFQERNIKGWLDALVIGDTGQAKTEIIKQLMGYYNLGTFASGESSSRTGLLYNIQMVQGQDAWIQYGLLCRANGMLVAIDEIHGMKPDDFKEFTRVRSEGVVNVMRYAWGSALAETRLISIANPKEGMSMESYGYPVMAILDLPIFKSKEDIRRFDFAIGVMAGEVGDDVLHTDVHDILSKDNPYTKDLCRDLLLWIWTRKPEEITITNTTEKYVLEKSVKFCRNWIADIPLVESADMRLKIVRIAAAIAGRVYNTEDGINLLIEKIHIDAAIEFLETIYQSPSLDYYGYSMERAKTILDDEEMDKLAEHFTQNFGINAEVIAKWVLSTNTFQKNIIKVALNLESSEVDQIISLFISNKFLDMGYSSKYRKTPMGRKFLRLVAGIDEIRDEEETDLIDETIAKDDF
jgi:hypothetical protein